MVNFTCNMTLEDMRISSEIPIAGNYNFHQLGLIIAAACAGFSIIVSFWSMWMHALNYTKPNEQRHIIRILLMIPVYSVAAFLGFWFYWHWIYYQVISDCYEAFAIASFFALLCHYIAPTLHDQKEYFRNLQPIKPWVLPLSWFARCCGGERGPWRTPRSGLTWFNIIYAGIYQYCFIRVVMTITAVLTEYFGVYCESSNMPWFGHIWILVIEGIAVTIAMYCVIQFYIQLHHDLAPHGPFLKVLAIKLVIFLSFWQTFAISILTSSTLHILTASDKLAYPDISVGIPALLLCVEMAIFSVLHIFAYPHKEYIPGRETPSKYPSGLEDPDGRGYNSVGPKQGGWLGLKAFGDALNPWDLVKAFGRGMRWLFVGFWHRKADKSYTRNADDLALEPTATTDTAYYGPNGLPIADEFRRSKFGVPSTNNEEGEGLIAHAQPEPHGGYSQGYTPGLYTPARQRYDPATGQELSGGGTSYPQPGEVHPALRQDYNIGVASSGLEDDPSAWSGGQEIPGRINAQSPNVGMQDPSRNATHQMMWGQSRNPTQSPSGRFDEQI